MKDEKGPLASRRSFLGRSALLGGALSLPAAGAAAQPDNEAAAARLAPTPSPRAEVATPPPAHPMTFKRSGADFMVDVIKSLDIDYVASNPGSSFRGLQESLINYGGNKKPEFLTCCHEESSVAMAHGYYKIAGKPMIAMAHGTVGLQHAAMAVYNAYGDRTPVIVIAGNSLDANSRRPGVEWWHSVQDCAAIVRDYTKWDDMPVSLQHFAESQVRAIKVATSVPMGPVVLTVDAELQEAELSPARQAGLSIPRLSLDRFPAGDSAAVEEAAALLVAAERPVIFAHRYARNQAGSALLVELAELLQAPVIDTGERFNFPSHHPLNLTEDATLLREADVVLALEVAELWSFNHSLRDVPGRPWRQLRPEGPKIVSIGTAAQIVRANYQDFQRYAETEISIPADAQATLPGLIEAVRRRVDTTRRSALQQRGAALGDRGRARDARFQTMVQNDWDLNPVSSPRILMELWEQIKNDDWSLVGWYYHTSNMARRLWPMTKYYHQTGSSGAGGVGYGAPAAVGGALANRDAGRLSVCIQSDGDLMYAPGVLWTAAHHKIPLLFVMFNNRGYHQELMHMQRMSTRHERGIETFGVGTTLTDPNIDYAKLASSMGVYSEGPISDPSRLRGALKRALAVVRRGEPALVDVVTQPR